MIRAYFSFGCSHLKCFLSTNLITTPGSEYLCFTAEQGKLRKFEQIVDTFIREQKESEIWGVLKMLSPLSSVSVFCGCCNEISQILWLKTTYTDYFIVLEVRSSKWGPWSQYRGARRAGSFRKLQGRAGPLPAAGGACSPWPAGPLLSWKSAMTGRATRPHRLPPPLPPSTIVHF